MRRSVLTTAFIAVAAATAGASAQEAVSILRGTLADTLAERAGEGTGRGAPTDPTDEPVVDELATLTEDQLDEDVAPGDDDDADADEDDGIEGSLFLRAGYDTNYDELVEPEDTRFVEISGDVAVARTIGDTDVFVSGSGSFLELADLEFDARFEAEGAVGLRHEIGDGVFLEAAAGAAVDGLDDPVILEPAAAVALQVIRPFAAVAVRASFDAETTIATRFEENEGDNIDFERYSLDSTLVLQPEAVAAPVVSGRISRVRFPDADVFFSDEDEEIVSDEDGEIVLDEDEEVVSDEGEEIVGPSRDAYDMTLAAGYRFRPSDDLSITLSARANRRDFEAPGLPTLYTYFPDAEVVWSLSDDASLSLSTTRIIDQPGEDGSRAQDVRSYAAEYDFDPDLGFGWSAAGGYSQIREIGIESDSDESFAELTLRYKPLLDVIVEMNLLQTWTRDITFGDDTKSTQVSTGVRSTF